MRIEIFTAVRGGRGMLRIALWTALLTAAPAVAQPHEQRFFGRVGALLASADTRLRFDAPALGTEGTEIDLENDFDLDSSEALPAGEVGFWLSKDWQVQFEYFSFGRSKSTALQRTITVEDVEYAVGAEIESEFKSTLYKLAIGWVPIQTDKGQLGFSLGLHATDFSFGISGEASVDGESSEFRQVNRAQLAPLPTIGISGKYEIVPDVALVASFDLFALKFDKYSGNLIDAELGVNWQATKNFGLGASWRIIRYDFGVENENWNGRINYKLSGPMLFVTFGF